MAEVGSTVMFAVPEEFGERALNENFLQVWVGHGQRAWALAVPECGIFFAILLDAMSMLKKQPAMVFPEVVLRGKGCGTLS